MFYRVLIVASALMAALPAFAQSQSQMTAFNWKTNGSFTMEMVLNGFPLAFKGEIAEENGDATTQAEGYTAHVKTYAGFVSIIAGRDGDEMAYLFLLEKKNRDFEQMNIQPISGRSAEIVDDLKYSLERFAALKRLDGKDPSFAFRTMVAYFEDAPSKTLDSFANDVENNVEVVRQVPPPTTKDTASVGPDVQPPASNDQPIQDQAPRYEDPNGNPIDPNYDTYQEPRPKKRRKAQPPPQPDWSNQREYYDPNNPNSYPEPPRPNRGVADFIPDWAKPRQQRRQQQQRRPLTQQQLQEIYRQGGGLY